MGTGGRTRSWERVKRATLRGALIGAVLSLLISLEFWSTMASGQSASSAGYGAGILSWLASVPVGLVLLYVVAFPAAHALGFQESIPRNMVLILTFGVVGNWTLLGTMYGSLRAIIAKLWTKSGARI